MADNSMTGSLTQLEMTLNEYLVKKAPNLPPGVKEFIVKIAPWLTLIGVVIAIPVILLALGLGAMFAPFGMMGDTSATVGGMISMVLTLVSLVLSAMAIQPLFRREKKGWNYVFYSDLVGIVSTVVSIVMTNGASLIGGVIGTLIGFYILFQVREYYK